MLFRSLVHGLLLSWSQGPNYREIAQWTAAALEHAGALPADARAEILAYAGFGANYGNRFDEAMTLYESSLACSRDAGLSPFPFALSCLGIAALESNDPAEAIARCEEALDAARAAADGYWETYALGILSLACSLSGDEQRGRGFADEALARARRLRNTSLISSALLDAGIARVTSEPDVAIELLEECAHTNANSTNLGQTYFFRGIAHLRLRQPSEAARALRAALPLMQQTGSDFFTATVIGTAAGLLARAAPGATVRLLSALDRFRAESGIAGAPGDLEVQRRTRTRLEEAMAPAEFTEAWSRGAELNVEEAAALAHDELGRLEE